MWSAVFVRTAAGGRSMPRRAAAQDDVVTPERTASAGRVDLAPLLNDERVQTLIAARRRRYVALSSLVCAVYAVVALGCAFAPALMARPAVGASISVGVVSIATVMVVGIVTSGYYTWWANTVHDRQLDEALRTAADRER